MNDTCIAGNSVVEKSRDLKYSLIWSALWVVALTALLILPAIGR